MTNNTIPNVPRDDLDLIRVVLEGFKPCIARDDALRTVRTLLSAPSPAGVYSADPLACPGCASGCFRCASPGGVDADHVEDVRASTPPCPPARRTSDG